MKKQESLFSQVEEREISGEIFQVTHRLLRVPREVYLKALHGYDEPFSEAVVQEFVEQYLKWCGDKDGVIGMVRFSEENGAISIDAAVRYRINPNERPSCQR